MQKKYILNFKKHTNYSEWLCGIVECSFEHHVDKFLAKAHSFLFRFPICFEKKLLFWKLVFPRNVSLDTLNAFLSSLQAKILLNVSRHFSVFFGNVENSYITKKLFWICLCGHINYSSTNPAARFPPWSPNFPNEAQKSSGFFLRETKFLKLFLWIRTMQSLRQRSKFRGRVDRFHLSIRK